MTQLIYPENLEVKYARKIVKQGDFKFIDMNRLKKKDE